MISSIYTIGRPVVPDAVAARLERIFRSAIDTHGSVTVFFRADDIGPPSKNFSRMMNLFVQYHTPLCLAVVPAWMTRPRWEAMRQYISEDPALFCWHMHGFLHRNHEPDGKKQEFGPARTPADLRHDLSKGVWRLQTLMGDALTPVFTPPWNRCSLEAMMQLKQLGFKGVSRSAGSRPQVPEGITDLSIHVDLHTRKEPVAQDGWEGLCNQFDAHLGARPCGIMLHHMRMNTNAFDFLAYLLHFFSRQKRVKTVTFRDLV